MSTVRSGDCENYRACDLIIIIAGKNRKSGGVRPDLAKHSVEVLKMVVDSIKPLTQDVQFLLLQIQLIY